MSVTVNIGKHHLLAGVFLLGLSVLVGGALSAPPSSQALTTTYTRSASCAGLDFYPTDSSTEYSNNGTLRVRTSSDGSGVFRCDPGLPTGAVVTKVQFTVQLEVVVPAAGGTGVGSCALRRSGLTTTTAATAETIGAISPSVPTGGIYRINAPVTANKATIDNSSYGYWLECWSDYYYDLGIGIYGAERGLHDHGRQGLISDYSPFGSVTTVRRCGAAAAEPIPDLDKQREPHKPDHHRAVFLVMTDRAGPR